MCIRDRRWTCRRRRRAGSEGIMARKLGGNLGIDADETMDIVGELQLAQRGQAGALRAASVRKLQTPVLVRPADSVDRDRVVASGETRDLRATSVTAVLSR